MMLTLWLNPNNRAIIRGVNNPMNQQRRKVLAHDAAPKSVTSMEDAMTYVYATRTPRNRQLIRLAAPGIGGEA